MVKRNTAHWSHQRWYCHDLQTTPSTDIGHVLVSGASGYIGGRLVPELQARGYRVRTMVRRASDEQQCLWPGAEVAVADALCPESLHAALSGIEVAYYLIHSLNLGPRNFAGMDIQAAVNFRRAAERQMVKRIIYFGGLGDMNAHLSDHLQSRMAVAEELGRGAIPVTVLRAATVIGSGSASYEIIRHLAERMPLALVPGWGRNKCQPIGIRDVIKYLVGVLEIPETTGLSFDIGGKDVLSYEEMLREFARILGRNKIFVICPFSFTRVCAYAASLVTPVPAPLIHCLFDSLRNHAVCENDAVRHYLSFSPLGYEEMITRAMAGEQEDRVYTRWTDAYPPAYRLAQRLDELTHSPRYVAAYSLITPEPASALYKAFCNIGGREGWFQNNWLWRARGMIDRLLLGSGSLRGRRSALTLKTNDVIDFWRVEDLQPDRRLLLRAEMRLPGRAWLEFNIHAAGDTRNQLSVIAYFDTSSFWGKAYWYICLPLHHFIFSRLLGQITRRSKKSKIEFDINNPLRIYSDSQITKS